MAPGRASAPRPLPFVVVRVPPRRHRDTLGAVRRGASGASGASSGGNGSNERKRRGQGKGEARMVTIREVVARVAERARPFMVDDRAGTLRGAGSMPKRLPVRRVIMQALAVWLV